MQICFLRGVKMIKDRIVHTDFYVNTCTQFVSVLYNDAVLDER